ncbi:MAG: hypothetical protein H6814_11350 [Phycisphaeraceae bacterium]|nr:hypothetical protein [Phycisphaeraceae bacterium]
MTLTEDVEEFMTTLEGDVVFDTDTLSTGTHTIEVFAVTGDPRILDYDADGDFDCADVRQYEDDATGVTAIEPFDFNGDGISDSDDVEIYEQILSLGFGEGTQCPVFGDINEDGCVDTADLGILTSSFGTCPGCPADLNDDGVVDTADLGLLLGAFGDGC